MAHTPGPWYANDECIECAGPEGPRDVTLAVVTHSADAQADARLIAAAPKLLAVLKVIRDDLLTLDSGDVGNGVDGWRHMDATLVDQLISGSFRVAYDAIAKAEGEGD